MSEEASAGATERVTARLRLPSGDEKWVVASVVDGSAVFEGDIVLGTVDPLPPDASEQERGAVVSDPGKLWPDAFVPYRIDKALPAPERVREAIAHWEEHTALRFEEVADEPEAGWISFEDQGACFSEVGFAGRKQVVSLGAGCTSGNAIHEIGHSVGLWHEQSRNDRGLHVRILVQNIIDGQAHNFDSMVNEVKDEGDYDFGSIMHYGPKFFSKNDQPTIEPLEPLPPGVVMGQRNALSAGDIAAIAGVYGPRPT
jgi:hypothetical protein